MCACGIIVHCSTRGLARAEPSSDACTRRAIDQVPLSRHRRICTCVVGKCVIRSASSHSGRYRTKTVLTSKAFAPSHEPHLTRPACRSIGIYPVSFVELSIAHHKGPSRGRSCSAIICASRWRAQPQAFSSMPPTSPSWKDHMVPVCFNCSAAGSSIAH